MQVRYGDPVTRQSDALRRLWGGGATQIARRYLTNAQRLRRTDQIDFWQQVVACLALPAPPFQDAAAAPAIVSDAVPLPKTKGRKRG